MKVVIGPYLKWWGPYQIADLVFGNPPNYIDEKDETWRHRWSHRLGEWLAGTWVADACQWIHDRRQRQQYVRIDRYDHWNMDETLRIIIGPLLVQLKKHKQGSGMVDDEDVPEHLRSTAAPPVAEAWDLDDNFHSRYEWLLDELIWAFCTDHEAAKDRFYDHSAVDHKADLNTQLHQMHVDRHGLEAYEARLQQAYCLFGKYYQTLWD